MIEKKRKSIVLHLLNLLHDGLAVFCIAILAMWFYFDFQLSWHHFAISFVLALSFKWIAKKLIASINF